jgi:hypothetical protein
MKKFLVSIIAVMMILAFSGCRSAPEGVTDPTMPPWVNDQPPEGEIWGIGMSDNTTVSMRMTVSQTRALQDIARQLQVLSQGMVRDYQREAGGIDDTAAMQFQEEITRQIAQANIQGAVRDVMWNTPDGKALWTRMKISKDDAAKSVDDLTKKAIDSDAARYAEFKAMDAEKMMDAQIDKTATSPVPVTR